MITVAVMYSAAVFFIEPVRRLDLLHLVACRYVNGQKAFDLPLFAWRRLEQVEPDGFTWNCRAGAQLETRQALGLRDEGAEHRVTVAPGSLPRGR